MGDVWGEVTVIPKNLGTTAGKGNFWHPILLTHVSSVLYIPLLALVRGKTKFLHSSSGADFIQHYIMEDHIHVLC